MYLFLLASIIPFAESAVQGECDLSIKGWYQVGKGADATCFYCKDDNGDCLDTVFKDNICINNNIYDKYCSYSNEKFSGYDGTRGINVNYDFCGDQADNDKDTAFDFADSDCQENLQTPTYSTPAVEGSTITATCPFIPLVNGQLFSGYTFQNFPNGRPTVEAYLGGASCGAATWSGNNAVFTCSVGSQSDLECKSIQQAKIDPTTTNVPIQLKTCAQKGEVQCRLGQICSQTVPSSDNPNCCVACKSDSNADSNDKDVDGYTDVASGGNDCNDNNANIHPGAVDICDGIDNDCNPATVDGSGETAPLNDKQLGVCSGTRKICAGATGWQNNYPAGYEDGTELACTDSKDNDCDGSTDCADNNCATKSGPNGLVCCQIKSDCPLDGSEAFTGCLNDNTRQGGVGTFTCELNECKSSTTQATSSCNTNCCLPGGGSAICVNSGKSSVIDVDNDAQTEVCDAGNWIGANCVGNKCNDDGTAPHPNYNCAGNPDCQGNIGQCGEEVCLSNVCITREKTNKTETCNNLMPAGYQCAKFFSCSAATNYNCQYAGDSTLCSDKYPIVPGRDPYDTACSGNPDFKCKMDVCISPAVTSNPCCLCYSQCIKAANDPNVAPDSTAECNIAKNFQWTNTQCPFTGGG